jgi:hypothetical protein
MQLRCLKKRHVSKAMKLQWNDCLIILNGDLRIHGVRILNSLLGGPGSWFESLATEKRR